MGKLLMLALVLAVWRAATPLGVHGHGPWPQGCGMDVKGCPYMPL